MNEIVESLKNVYNKINKKGMYEQGFEYRKGFNNGLKTALDIIEKEIENYKKELEEK